MFFFCTSYQQTLNDSFDKILTEYYTYYYSSVVS